MQDIDFRRGIWAVAAVPGYGLVIGCIYDSGGVTRDDVINWIRRSEPVAIDPCFGFKADAIPVQGPQGIGVTFFRQCTPLANCVGPGRLTTIIYSAVFLLDMEESDLKRHKGLVEQLVKQLKEAQAKETGIVLANAGDMPRGKSRT